MKQETHKFQNGKEILEYYIPGYTPFTKEGITSLEAWDFQTSARSIADTIIGNFRGKIKKADLLEE